MEKLLPTEITLDIFSRLPAESVLECRRVCKTWRTLLRHPHFADMHLSRSLQLDKLGILYLQGEYHGYEKQLYYGEYDDNDKRGHMTLKKINYPSLIKRDQVVGSCNGLICFSRNGRYDINDSIIICNPITREWVHLPFYNDPNAIRGACTQPFDYGFGYLSSTNEYKVVRILFHSYSYNPEALEWVGSVEVYTLGGGSGWRNKGEITGFFSLYCVHANGALHWLDDNKMKILVFDLADEEFHVLPLPPSFAPGENNFFDLRVLGGLLCVVHKKVGESINIWSLKENTSGSCDIKEQAYQSWSWHMECSMAWEGLDVFDYEPFAFTKSGDVLMLHICSIVSRYDPQTAILEDLDTYTLVLQEAICHMNTFVSLKALGEDVKTIGSAEGLLAPEML